MGISSWNAWAPITSMDFVESTWTHHTQSRQDETHLLHTLHIWVAIRKQSHGLPLNILLVLGWSEPPATNAPVQDEAVQAVLGMNQKHTLFPCPGIFQPSFLPQNCPLLPTSPPSYLTPPPTSLTSFPTHSISRALLSSWAWVAQSFEEMWDTRLEEGGELNVEGMWRGESKRSAHPKCISERRKVSSLPSLQFFSSLWFVFFFVFFFLFFA